MRILTIIFGIMFIASCNGKHENKKNIDQEFHTIVKDKKWTTDVKVLTLNEIPESIRLNCNFVTGRKWTDTDGENILTVFRSDIKISKDNFETEETLDVEFFVVKYTIVDNVYIKNWTIYDRIKNCSFDIYIGLANENAVYISDIDNNGFTEVSIAYYLTCRSDITPATYKFIMREQNAKYALRGKTLLEMYKKEVNLVNFQPNLSKVKDLNLDDIDKEIQNYGRYENENDFKFKPSFLQFAKEKWILNMIEKEFKQLN